jgi:hypothetical protein
MKPWISKKMMEYLGAEENDLCKFIVAKISKECNPEDLLSK